jgi:nicotinate-nucleotide adenylyltransferase
MKSQTQTAHSFFKKDKVGLFFGSFDPIHNGHLLVAEVAQSRIGLDEVWFVVTPHNPLKQNPLLDTVDRVMLVSDSINYNEKFRVCTDELKMEEPIYTYKTLEMLRTKLPHIDFYYIMGTDCLDNLDKWKNIEDILKHHKIICYPRDNKERKTPIIIKDTVAKVLFLHSKPTEVSSTQIRNEKDLNKIKNLLPKPVFKFLQKRNENK